MIDLEKIEKIYFIGIGGIGMSALARYFKSRGKQVSGYDKTETLLTRQLTQEGIAVHYRDAVDLIPKDAGLVVYTPAVPGDLAELTYFRQQHTEVLKRSDVLGEITRSSFNICVAGTHGKTTISTMIAHILRDSGYGCNAFLGGIAVNYDSNFWSDPRRVCVVEADEYDRSFLKLSPDIAVISAMDPDHLDIYGTAQAMEEAFMEFSAQVKPGGLLLSKYELKKNNLLRTANHKTYSLQNPKADVYAQGVEIEGGSYRFNIHMQDWTLEGVELNIGGMHNVENVTAAIAVARTIGIAGERIKNAVRVYRGVKRRFEYVIRPGLSTVGQGVVFIDDYAHHPEELRALITSARQLFPNRRCTVIFQPHLYSRTRDFAEGFAASLDLADEVILLPIYPARERPMPGVTSELIADKMRSAKKHLLDKKEVLDWIGHNRLELLITAGAGDIDNLVAPIKLILEQQS
jgi:UDP-N-acetylmuramate--alanine ligase